MDIKKCDRCGTMMFPDELGYHFYKRSPFRICERDLIFKDREIDLCEDCREDFKKFLKEKKDK